MVGTLQEHVERNMAPKMPGDGGELTDFDKKIIGAAVRIEIPFGDVYNMRRIADLLRGYAETLDVYSRRTDLPARSILNHLKMEAKAINYRIAEMSGRREAKRAYRRHMKLD